MRIFVKKFNKWIIEFISEKPGINPLMGWESSTDTSSELKLELLKIRQLRLEVGLRGGSYRLTKLRAILTELQLVLSILNF